MNEISEQEFREAIIATKKDAKLVGAAKNDRINSPEALYKEFIKLPIDRQKEIIASISNEQFVGGQWKITFPLNNLPAANVADAVAAAGKALFFSREEDSVKETIRVIRTYQGSPFFKTLVSSLGEAAEIVRSELYTVAGIFTNPEMYGFIHTLDPESPGSAKIVQNIAKVATYTRDWGSTMKIARFLYARRHSSTVEAVATLLENTIFMARDKRSVQEILNGFGAGSVDHVLKRHSENRTVLSAIREVALKTRDSQAIRTYLGAL